ncbi:ubiquitin carboxyl-terminal hydrolase [Stylonychia lemnae]|uniref:Ubiquitin carboxyl-terminal hydrolase n=1 Tax=Stylonychia lemnae TaxID=5949 RepID=A0A078A1I0_STYLE|nr:ubiquitin carboxyl-terminal hydrolase [Stylonychia lemnae]|eukprot:CDW74639.1 ubiquitin carboxyl-terminal hydrolase [Stylonychia lemnae]
MEFIDKVRPAERLTFTERVEEYTQKLQEEHQANNNHISFEKSIVLEDQQAQQILDSLRIAFQKGRVNEKTLDLIMGLHVGLVTTLAQRYLNSIEKEILEKLFQDNLRFLYCYLMNTADESWASHSEEVLRMLYVRRQYKNEGGFRIFEENVKEQMRILYPAIKKQPKVKLLSIEERRAQGKQIMEMIKNTNCIPQKEGEKYHVISLDWFKAWQQYTFCDENAPKFEDELVESSQKLDETEIDQLQADLSDIKLALVNEQQNEELVIDNENIDDQNKDNVLTY